MQLNRRNFFKGSLALAAVSATGIATLGLTGCSDAWVATAQKDIPIVQGILTSLVGVALEATGNGALDGAANTVISVAVAAAQTALSTVTALFDNYQKNPSAGILSQIVSSLETVQTQMNSILTAAHITNTALVNIINTGVALAISTISSIELLIPGSTGVAISANVVHINGKPKLMKAEDIKKAYNVVVVKYGYASHQV